MRSALSWAVVAACLLLHAAAQQPAQLRVGFYIAEGSEPFTTFTNGQPGGFEVELMRVLCGSANFSCSFTPLGTLEERIAAVANGTVDASIGELAYTPERDAAIDNVHMYYYLSGTAL